MSDDLASVWVMSALDALRGRLSGPLRLPDDAAFDEARRPWNLSVEQRPAAVAEPAGVDDLVALVAFAREEGVMLAVQPCGHGAASALEGAVLVRPRAFDALEIDQEARIARIGAGVAWGAVIDALDGTGLVAPAGTSRVVSATGYTLGGGHSWFSRSAGLGSDALRAAWIVRPDGTHERVDDASDPETMWALRGAGGIAGIVTEIEIDLVAAPVLVGGSIVFGSAHSADALRAVRDLAAVAPPSLNLFATSMRMPDVPQLPEAIRARSFLTVDVLAIDEAAAEFLEPIRAAAPVEREDFGHTTPALMASRSAEPTDPTPTRGVSSALRSLDDALLDDLLTFRALPEQAPLVGLGLRMLGGALDSPRREGFASLSDAAWLVHGLAPITPGAPREPGDASLAGLREILGRADEAPLVPTFLAPEETLERAGTRADLDRLRAIRERVDPDAVLHEGRLPR